MGAVWSRALCVAAATSILWLAPCAAQAQQAGDQQTVEAGGPQGQTGPYVIPKKKDEPAPPPTIVRPAPSAEGASSVIRTQSTLVNVDVAVLTKDGYPIPNLEQKHFRVLEDGVEQKVVNFSRSEAPMTTVLLVEFANVNYNFVRDSLRAAYSFADNMKKDDYIAVVTYDMRTETLQDFTQDKQAVYSALNTLRIPGFSETNLYDALFETFDRMDRIPGRKQIVVVTRGMDTMSRINYDKLMKKVKDTPNVTLYGIGVGRAFMELLDARYNSSFGNRMAQMDYRMGEQLLSNLCAATGGRTYFPHFQGELPEIYKEVTQAIRTQYVLSYKPTNTAQDGGFRKLDVQLVAPGTTTPLTIADQKGKQLKYKLIYRSGYRARHEVE